MPLCGRLGSIGALFAVVLTIAPASPARTVEGSRATGMTVVVLDSGFSQKVYGHTGGSSGSYGVLLMNRSTTEDAFGVTVKVSAVGNHGRPLGPLATTTKKIALIPAGVKFAVGDFWLVIQGKISRLAITVGVGRTRPKRAVLPSMSHLRYSRVGGEITGVLSNPYAGAVSPYDVTFHFITYNARGDITGGGESDGVGADLPAIASGRRAPFDVFDISLLESHAANVRISVDPGYLPHGGIPRR